MELNLERTHCPTVYGSLLNVQNESGRQSRSATQNQQDSQPRQQLQADEQMSQEQTSSKCQCGKQQLQNIRTKGGDVQTASCLGQGGHVRTASSTWSSRQSVSWRAGLRLTYHCISTSIHMYPYPIHTRHTRHAY